MVGKDGADTFTDDLGSDGRGIDDLIWDSSIWGVLTRGVLILGMRSVASRRKGVSKALPNRRTVSPILISSIKIMIIIVRINFITLILSVINYTIRFLLWEEVSLRMVYSRACRSLSSSAKLSSRV